jgi:hypothetical protein
MIPEADQGVGRGKDQETKGYVKEREEMGYKPMRYMELEVVIRKLDKQTLKLYSVGRAEVEER